MSLNPCQVEEFQNLGYLVVSGLLPAGPCSTL